MDKAVFTDIDGTLLNSEHVVEKDDDHDRIAKVLELLNTYQAVDSILRRIDFGALAPGFRKYKYAFYNSEAICLDGKLLPYDAAFCGNTAIEYRGEQVAVWNLAHEKKNDAEILAYCMVHEMYHCFQHENGEIRYSDDFRLLNYPADLENYVCKYQENQLLIEAYRDGDEKALLQFCEIRNERLGKFQNAVLEELKAETCEGMAEYIGLKALRRIDEKKYEEILNRTLERLKNDISLLFDVRRLSYDVGAVFALTLERLGLSVKNDFSGPTVYEQSRITDAAPGFVQEAMAQTVVETSFSAIREAFYRKLEENEQKIQESIAGAKYTPLESDIWGYDPMNMIRFGDLILCSHFVWLKGAGETLNLSGPVTLKMKAGADRAVEGYYVKACSGSGE